MRNVGFRFRPGALDTICTTRNLATDSQLAALLGVSMGDLRLLRQGKPCNVQVALRVCAIQGTDGYPAAWFEPVEVKTAGKCAAPEYKF